MNKMIMIKPRRFKKEITQSKVISPNGDVYYLNDMEMIDLRIQIVDNQEEGWTFETVDGYFGKILTDGNLEYNEGWMPFDFVGKGLWAIISKDNLKERAREIYYDKVSKYYE